MMRDLSVSDSAVKAGYYVFGFAYTLFIANVVSNVVQLNLFIAIAAIFLLWIAAQLYFWPMLRIARSTKPPVTYESLFIAGTAASVIAVSLFTEMAIITWAIPAVIATAVLVTLPHIFWRRYGR